MILSRYRIHSWEEVPSEWEYHNIWTVDKMEERQLLQKCWTGQLVNYVLFSNRFS
jgi:hypothetical protein